MFLLLVYNLIKLIDVNFIIIVVFFFILIEFVMNNFCFIYLCFNNGICFDDINSVGIDLKLLNVLYFCCFCLIGYSGIVCESKKMNL